MKFEAFLQQNRNRFEPLFDPVLTAANTVYMELSISNREFDGFSEVELDQAIQRSSSP